MNEKVLTVLVDLGLIPFLRTESVLYVTEWVLCVTIKGFYLSGKF